METADLSHHISRRFNEDLERVRSKVLGMGGFVEQQLHKAITALIEGDSTLGESVAMDDYQVNNMEVSIDEECSRILATRAPVVICPAMHAPPSHVSMPPHPSAIMVPSQTPPHAATFVIGVVPQSDELQTGHHR